MVWLRNPETGRNILKGGRTYLRLKKDGVDVDSFQKVRSRYTSPKRKKSTGRKSNKRTYRRSPSRLSGYSDRISPRFSPKSPSKLPSKSKVRALGIANPRSLSETLKDVPKSRKAKRERLKKEIKRKGEGRGSPTRGWRAAAPQKGNERKKLYKKCGEACFLEPDESTPGQSGFPICAALREKQGCKIDCRGLMAAKIRARQYKHKKVADFAEKLYQEKCE